MHECQFKDIITEMHGDVKSLVKEVTTMNGSVKRITEDFNEHKKESDIYRYRITIIWFIMQGIKWTIGGGLLTGVILLIVRFKVLAGG